MADKAFKKVIIGGDVAAWKCIQRCFLNATVSPHMKLVSGSSFCTKQSSSVPYGENGIEAPPSPNVEALGTQLHWSHSWDQRCEGSDMVSQAFEEVRHDINECIKIREHVQSIFLEIKSATELLRSSLLHESGPILPDVLEKANGQIYVMKELFKKLAESRRECPELYYMFEDDDWRSGTQTGLSLLVFKHWLQTRCLLSYGQADEELGLNSLKFGLDPEDYFCGLCLMSNELSRYAAKQVLAGDYDGPKEAFEFLKDVVATFGIFATRNKFCREKFNEMKDNLTKIEGILSDTTCMIEKRASP